MSYPFPLISTVLANSPSSSIYLLYETSKYLNVEQTLLSVDQNIMIFNLLVGHYLPSTKQLTVLYIYAFYSTEISTDTNRSGDSS